MTSINAVLLETVKMSVRQLHGLPDSPEKDALHACCLMHLETLDTWSTRPPNADERSRLINAVLSTHKAVVDLARRMPH
jgi:hypothetical protein